MCVKKELLKQIIAENLILLLKLTASNKTLTY